MSEKRLLTAEKSKLGSADLSTMLRKEAAWETLPLETREELYSMLPRPKDGETPHDPALNPLQTQYRPFIEEALRVWQNDLKGGKENKVWRGEALQAGVDRREGKFEGFVACERENDFGKVSEEE